MSAATAPIPLKEVLRQIHEGGHPFSIEFCTLDKTRGTAGKLMTIPVAVNSAPGRGKVKREVPLGAGHTGRTTSPAHAIHNTINLYNATERNPKKRIVKVHIRLITLFNGIEVS